MPASPRERALAYLQAHNVLTLATTGPEGPWASAVFYANEGFTLYFLSSPKSRHARNIAARSSVAGAVQEDYGDWPEIKGIQLEGVATPLEGEPRDQARALYARRHPSVAEPTAELAAALARVAWYRLTPGRLYFIDNALGFGHRDEVPLAAPRT